MHWGHAVSQDLLHWKHFPIALYPVNLKPKDTFLKGGAFSGSSVVTANNNSLLIVFTSHE